MRASTSPHSKLHYPSPPFLSNSLCKNGGLIRRDATASAISRELHVRPIPIPGHSCASSCQWASSSTIVLQKGYVRHCSGRAAYTEHPPSVQKTQSQLDCSERERCASGPKGTQRPYVPTNSESDSWVYSHRWATSFWDRNTYPVSWRQHLEHCVQVKRIPLSQKAGIDISLIIAHE